MVRELIVGYVVVTVDSCELSLSFINRSRLIVKWVNEVLFIAKTGSRRISLVLFPHLSDLGEIH